jgi:hypothetical protein
MMPGVYSFKEILRTLLPSMITGHLPFRDRASNARDVVLPPSSASGFLDRDNGGKCRRRVHRGRFGALVGAEIRRRLGNMSLIMVRKLLDCHDLPEIDNDPKFLDF